MSGTGTATERANVNLAISDHLLTIGERLVHWLGMHVEAQGLYGPTNYRNPRNACRWLAHHTDWAAKQPWIVNPAGWQDRDPERAGYVERPGYLQDLGSLAAKARGLLNPQEQKHVSKIVPCPEADCPGRLIAVLVEASDTITENLVMTCDTNPAHSYRKGEMRAVGRRIARKEAA